LKHNETRNVTLLSRIVNRIILLLYRLEGLEDRRAPSRQP
jgi:hypothetical protein